MCHRHHSDSTPPSGNSRPASKRSTCGLVAKIWDVLGVSVSKILHGGCEEMLHQGPRIIPANETPESYPASYPRIIPLPNISIAIPSYVSILSCFLCVYIHTHIHIYIYICTSIRLYKNNICIYFYKHIDTRIYIYIYAYRIICRWSPGENCSFLPDHLNPSRTKIHINGKAPRAHWEILFFYSFLDKYWPMTPTHMEVPLHGSTHHHPRHPSH